MIRFLTILGVLALSFAGPALAADDGGFGTQRFSNQAATALGDDSTANPAAIEPAAGDEPESATTPDEPAKEPAPQTDEGTSPDAQTTE